MDIDLAQFEPLVIQMIAFIAAKERKSEPFLDWLSTELRAELSRRKHGRPATILRFNAVPVSQVGTGVVIMGIIARRFTEWCEQAADAEALETLRSCEKLAVCIGFGCLWQIDGRCAARAEFN